jgi:hypothetical protein
MTYFVLIFIKSPFLCLNVHMLVFFPYLKVHVLIFLSQADRSYTYLFSIFICFSYLFIFLSRPERPMTYLSFTFTKLPSPTRTSNDLLVFHIHKAPFPNLTVHMLVFFPYLKVHVLIFLSQANRSYTYLFSIFICFSYLLSFLSQPERPKTYLFSFPDLNVHVLVFLSQPERPMTYLSFTFTKLPSPT